MTAKGYTTVIANYTKLGTILSDASKILVVKILAETGPAPLGSLTGSAVERLDRLKQQMDAESHLLQRIEAKVAKQDAMARTVEELEEAGIVLRDENGMLTLTTDGKLVADELHPPQD
jgi:ATP-dependent protease HslVU (ClpYQ) peptidase subunit